MTIATTHSSYRSFSHSARRSGLGRSILDSLKSLAARHSNEQSSKPAALDLNRPRGPQSEGVRLRRYDPYSKSKEISREKSAYDTSAKPPPTFKRPRCHRSTRKVLLESPQSDSRALFASELSTGPRRLNPSTMGSSIEFISTPTGDSPGTSLLLRTQKQSYIFGSQAEGTQRAIAQEGTRLTKVQDFFITGKMEWANTGGTIGLALTLADSTMTSYQTSMDVLRKNQAAGKVMAMEPTKPKLNIHGPPNLKHMLATCRRFIFRKGIPILVTEYSQENTQKSLEGEIRPSWEDTQIRVWALPVVPTERNEYGEKVEEEIQQQREIYDKYSNHFEEHKAVEGESPEEREARYDAIRVATINWMFDSDWNFDTLIERHISEVEMPAAMFVRDSDTNHLVPYSGPAPGGDAPLPDIKVFTRTPWPGARVVALPPTKPAPENLSYIVKTHPTRGIFDAKKAKELGIKPGKNFGRLAGGESLQNEKGETVTPEQVIGPDRPGQGVAILDVPSVSYFEALIQRNELENEEVMNGVQAYIWILGPGLTAHAAFQEYLKKRTGIKHVLSGLDNSPNRLTMDSVASQTTRLHQIDSARYMVPFHDNSTLPQNSLFGYNLGTSSLSSLNQDHAMVADRGLRFTLMPKYGVKKDNPPLLNISEVEKATDPEVIDLAKKAQTSIQNSLPSLQTWRRLVARPETEIITLGTGSSLPSKYRNVSATLVRVPGVGNYLLDCGENTLGQLQRMFPPNKLEEEIRNLRMIWISHLHADHHLGTAGIIKAWYQIVHNGVPSSSPPDLATLAAETQKGEFGLSVVSHEGMLKWLDEYSAIEDFGYSRIVPLQISPVRRSQHGHPGEIETEASQLNLNFRWHQTTKDTAILMKEDYEAVLGIEDIQAVRVSHCYGAMAVSLTFPQAPGEGAKKPLKISYSGDCRPSFNFARIGNDTTVLIHEATFDDELQGDAIAKKHSTTSEALGIGARMNAQAVVLTHFSQRYQKIPILETVQEGEYADTDESISAAQEPQETTEEDEADADAMDAEPTNPDVYTSELSTVPPQPTGKAPVLSLQHQQSSTSPEHSRVIKVRSKDMKVGIAFDYMRVKIGDIAELEHFNDALNKLLVKEESADDSVSPSGTEEGGGQTGEKRSSENDDGGGGSEKKKSKREAKEARRAANKEAQKGKRNN